MHPPSSTKPPNLAPLPPSGIKGNQYLSKTLIAFENCKHIYQYRTPQTLRAFSDFFIVVFPPLYGPYFAYIATNEESSQSAGLAYFMVCLLLMIFAAGAGAGAGAVVDAFVMIFVDVVDAVGVGICDCLRFGYWSRPLPRSHAGQTPAVLPNHTSTHTSQTSTCTGTRSR
jgi:hypothetical protein